MFYIVWPPAHVATRCGDGLCRWVMSRAFYLYCRCNLRVVLSFFFLFFLHAKLPPMVEGCLIC